MLWAALSVPGPGMQGTQGPEGRTFIEGWVGGRGHSSTEGALLAISALAGRQHGRGELDGVVTRVGTVLHHIQALHEALLLRGAIQ